MGDLSIVRACPEDVAGVKRSSQWPVVMHWVIREILMRLQFVVLRKKKKIPIKIQNVRRDYVTWALLCFIIVLWKCVSLHRATGEVPLSNSDMITVGGQEKQVWCHTYSQHPGELGSKSLWWKRVSGNDSGLQSIFSGLEQNSANLGDSAFFGANIWTNTTKLWKSINTHY